MGLYSSLYDTFLTFLVPIILVVGIYMYFNPSSSFTKSYEQVVNDRRQRRREIRQSLGINVVPT